jgi:di/tricarboxylate transporter
VIGSGHPWLVLATIYGTTMLLTEVLTNDATAAFMHPIAMAPRIRWAWTATRS